MIGGIEFFNNYFIFWLFCFFKLVFYMFRVEILFLCVIIELSFGRIIRIVFGNVNIVYIVNVLFFVGCCNNIIV